jgi:hypothetical protein
MSKQTLIDKQIAMLNKNRAEDNIPLDLVDFGAQDTCKCGRPVAKLHCPYCGTRTIRARHRYITRPHPHTGADTRFQMYVCDKCGLYFDSGIYKYNCTAPKPFEDIKREKQASKINAVIEEAISILVSGVRPNKVDGNFKKHFRKYVGMDFDTWISSPYGRATMDKYRIEKPKIVISSFPSNNKPILDAPTGFTHKDAYEAHCMNCMPCMTDNNPCEAGLTLKALMDNETSSTI